MHRFLLTAACLAAAPAAAVTVTFEDLSPAIAYGGPGGGNYEDGRNLAGSFRSGPLDFPNTFTDFGGGFSGWSGWAHSTTSDTTTPGFDNQFSAWPGSGAGGSATYAIAFENATIAIPSGQRVDSLSLANSSYAALSMRDGDSFAKQFGGPTGDDPDFFQVTISGFRNGAGLGDVTVDLADFRFADNAQDFILAQWLDVDLSPLAAADELALSFASSDVGSFGINTPTYVAVDNIVLSPVPEPSGLALAALGGLALLRRRR